MLPILISTPDWETYGTLFFDTFGFFPQKLLTEQKQDNQVPGALHGTLNPHKSLATNINNPDFQKHFYITLLYYMDDYSVLDILSTTNLECHRWHQDCFLLSGSIHAYKEAIIRYMIKDSEIKIRYEFNKLYSLIKQTHFRHIFSEYTEYKLNDSTLILE